MTREAVLSRLRLMGATMLAVFAASVLFGAILGAGLAWYIASASVGTAALIGLPIFTSELFFVNGPSGVDGGVDPRINGEQRSTSEALASVFRGCGDVS